MSHVTTNRLMNLVGAGHDILMKNWRDRLIADLKEKHVDVCKYLFLRNYISKYYKTIL